MSDTIYLDHNATTPLLGEVAEAMARWQSTAFGNPASQHAIGRRARAAVEDARDAIATMLGAQAGGRTADRVIFTSGGTEANNLALVGLVRSGYDRPGDVVISAIEHPSIVGPAEYLERRGWKVHRLPVDREGRVDLEKLNELLARRPRVCAVMLANNETGVLQPIPEIAARCEQFDVPLHTDAVQAVGKLPVDFRSLGASTMSVAAHKFHGPVGIGVLVVRHGIELEPILFGGFQQQALRPGTEPVALIVGMHAALEAWHRERDTRGQRLAALRDRFERELIAALGSRIVINSQGAPRAPHTSNVAFLGLDRQALLMALDQVGVCCSTGSACASGSSEPSSVLVAMGASDAVLHGSLRFSLGAMTSEADVDTASQRIVAIVDRMDTAPPQQLPSARAKATTTPQPR